MNIKKIIKILIFIAIIAVGISGVNAGLFDSSGNVYKGSGDYKVGEDIPAGEYYVKCNDGINCYVEIASDSSGTLDSIITNLNTVGGVYITVYEGEYLSVSGGDIYELADAPVPEPEGGYYPEGQYKVGEDIPAGEYTLEAIDGLGYVEITPDSRHDLFSIITNDNFETNKIITVSEGQYIEFSGAQLKA